MQWAYLSGCCVPLHQGLQKPVRVEPSPPTPTPQASRTRWRQRRCWRARAACPCPTAACGPCELGRWFGLLFGPADPALCAPMATGQALSTGQACWWVMLGDACLLLYVCSASSHQSLAECSTFRILACRVLAGDRAREWALSRGLSAAASSAEAAGWHLTDRSQRQWRKYRRMVDEGSGGGGDAAAFVAGAAPGPAAAAAAARRSREAPQANQQGAQPDQQQQQSQQRQQPGKEQQQGDKRRRVDSAADQQPSPPQREASEEGGASCFYDTVGCVVLAPDGSVAAGVSSGGILLKAEGRVGEAAAFGAGCWAQAAQPAAPRPSVPPKQQQEQAAAEQQAAVPPLPALACSVTGVGEAVMRHLLARDCCTDAAAAAEAASHATAAAGAAEAGLAAADGSDTEDGEGQPTSEPPLAQLAAALLQRTVLRGPPPHDCGLLCLKAQAIDEAPDAQRQNGGACGVGDGGRQHQQDRSPVRYAVEVSVAHCAQSMAFGHLACAPARGDRSGAGSSSSGGGASRAASPAVFVLRRQASCSGHPAPAVQTYTHGTTLLL